MLKPLPFAVLMLVVSFLLVMALLLGRDARQKSSLPVVVSPVTVDSADGLVMVSLPLSSSPFTPAKRLAETCAVALLRPGQVMFIPSTAQGPVQTALGERFMLRMRGVWKTASVSEQAKLRWNSSLVNDGTRLVPVISVWVLDQGILPDALEVDLTLGGRRLNGSYAVCAAD